MPSDVRKAADAEGIIASIGGKKHKRYVASTYQMTSTRTLADQKNGKFIEAPFALTK